MNRYKELFCATKKIKHLLFLSGVIIFFTFNFFYFFQGNSFDSRQLTTALQSHSQKTEIVHHCTTNCSVFKKHLSGLCYFFNVNYFTWFLCFCFVKAEYFSRFNKKMFLSRSGFELATSLF